MAEVIFILLTAYVVYVVRSVVTCNQRVKAEIAAAKPQDSITEVASKKDLHPVVKKKAPVKKSPPAKAKAKAKTKVPDGNLRNPETGEVAKMATSYRMCKRWIKEALVSEGLLEKIYKTNELDDAAKVKINKALDELAKMDKYL